MSNMKRMRAAFQHKWLAVCFVHILVGKKNVEILSHRSSQFKKLNSYL